MPLFDFTCENPQCGGAVLDHLVRFVDAPNPVCQVCGGPTRREDPLTAAPVFGAGRSAESQAAWQASQKERLTKRSVDYDKSPAGQQARADQIDRLKKNGTIPPGWSA